MAELAAGTARAKRDGCTTLANYASKVGHFCARGKEAEGEKREREKSYEESALLVEIYSPSLFVIKSTFPLNKDLFHKLKLQPPPAYQDN